MTAGLERLRQRGKSPGGLLGQLGRGQAWAQPLRVREGPDQSLSLLGIKERFQRNDMGFLHRVGEGGVDDDAVDVANNQQWGRLQGQGIQLQLLERGAQVFALALVFPAEAALFPDIGPTLTGTGFGRASLEAIPVAHGIGLVGGGLF